MSLRPVFHIALVVSALGACGGSGGSSNDLARSTDLSESADQARPPGLPTLTIDNTLSWCTVTVTVGTGAPSSFSSDSQTEVAAAGETITLSAMPNPGFMPVKWTGTTTSNGAAATYVMTAAAAQSITACCALSDGSGC